jgi:hypothetical protein
MTRTYNYNDALQRANNAIIPARTSTYTPIPHSEFLATLRDHLRNAGYSIVGQRLYTNENGQKLVGFYDLTSGNTPLDEARDMNMMIGFRNSYDKSMKIGLAAGGSVIICGNGAIMGSMMTFVKKHTGSVDSLLREKIQEVISQINENFIKLNIEVDIMKDYTLTRTQKAEILGRMYFDEELLTPNQLSIVKDEMNNSEHFSGNTAWDLYNNVTEALKTSHPIRHIEDHVRLHKFMAEAIGIDVTPKVGVDVNVITDAQNLFEEEVEEMDETIMESTEVNAEAEDFTNPQPVYEPITQEVVAEVLAATLTENPIIADALGIAIPAVEEVIEDEGEVAEAQDAIPTEVIEAAPVQNEEIVTEAQTDTINVIPTEDNGQAF